MRSVLYYLLISGCAANGTNVSHQVQGDTLSRTDAVIFSIYIDNNLEIDYGISFRDLNTGVYNEFEK